MTTGTAPVLGTISPTSTQSNSFDSSPWPPGGVKSCGRAPPGGRVRSSARGLRPPVGHPRRSPLDEKGSPLIVDRHGHYTTVPRPTRTGARNRRPYVSAVTNPNFHATGSH